MDERGLLDLALDAKMKSYSPYSKFRVGAALLSKNGKIYTGCNIENATYGATCCAERTAIFKAVSEGDREFKAIAIQGDNDDFTFPCGICRQVISEFGPDIEVILQDKSGNIRKFTLRELLPHAFYINT